MLTLLIIGIISYIPINNMYIDNYNEVQLTIRNKVSEYEGVINNKFIKEDTVRYNKHRSSQNIYYLTLSFSGGLIDLQVDYDTYSNNDIGSTITLYKYNNSIHDSLDSVIYKNQSNILRVIRECIISIFITSFLYGIIILFETAKKWFKSSYK